MVFRILFGAFPFIVYLLLSRTFLSPSYLGTRGRAIGMMVLLVCAAKFVCFGAFGGNAFAPELPEKLILAWNFAYSGMMILFALSLVGQMVRFLLRKAFVFNHEPPTTNHQPRTTNHERTARSKEAVLWLTALPVLSWGIAAWGIWNGTKLPEVREVELAFATLPEELDGYRIAHLTDIHASAAARRWRTEAIVEKTNALGADLVCLTGDYSDGDSIRQWRNVEPLSRLRAKDGVLAVTGNHEYYYDAFNWLQLYYSMTNVQFLVNRCVFPRKGLAVGGVNDIAAKQFGFTPPDATRLFDSATNGEFRIFLQHRPRVAENGLLTTPDLQLSGHTHGGVAPGMASLVAEFNGGFVKGIYPMDWQNTRFLNVSPGAGQWAGFPIRFFDDPEITLITLRRR